MTNANQTNLAVYFVVPVATIFTFSTFTLSVCDFTLEGP